MHIHYQIPQRATGWIPFIGFGGEVEFAHNAHNECKQENCITCEQYVSPAHFRNGYLDKRRRIL